MKHIYSRLFFLVLSLMSFAGSVKGQTITGVVYNEQNKPLPGATVIVKAHNLATSTNNNGVFNFTNIPSGKVELKVTFIGYKSQTKLVTVSENAKNEFNFLLKTETTNISEVSVFGEASVLYTEEIEEEYLERVQAADIKDIFADLPSVTIGGGGANAQRLYLRGIEGSNLNITIDGAKQGRSLYQHRGNAGSIDPGLLKKVSVATGADASQSSGALGGSISFETIDAQDLSYKYGKVGGKVSAGTYSASNGYVTRAILGIKLNPYIGLLVSGSLDDQNNYRAAESGIISYTAAKIQNYFAKLSILDYNFHELRLSSAYNRHSGYYIPGSSGSDMGIPADTLTFAATYQKMRRGTYTLDYRFSPVNPWVKIRANVYYNHRNLEIREHDFDVTSNNLGGSIKNDFKIEINGLKNKFTIGVDYDKENGLSKPMEANADLLGNKEVNNISEVFGAFAQGVSEFSIISVTYGARYDDYKSDIGPDNTLEGNEFSPNAGISVEPVKGLQIYGNYKEAIRATGIIPIQWMANIVEGANINNGKPFEPETSVMLDGGVRFSKKDLFTENDKLTASTKIFNTEIENLIEVLSGGRRGAPITGIMNDTLGVVSEGFEFSLGWEYKTFSTSVNYLHVDIEDKDGNPIEVTRRKAAPAGDRINWSTVWQATPEILVGYSLNAVSKLKDVYETARPAYTLHNIQMLWSPQTVKGLTASLAINNLFNKEYSEQTSIESGETIIPEAGRDIRITLTYNF